MNLVKRVNPVSLSLSAAGLAGTASGLVGSLAKGAARGLARTVASEHDEVDEAPREQPSARPNVVLAEPHAPEEPPVDVVGMALAAEAEAESGAVAHEPRAASREEEHGAALQRTTVEEIVDETTAALEGDVDPEPHLTAPVLDASDTKAAMAELSTMSRAADPDKG